MCESLYVYISSLSHSLSLSHTHTYTSASNQDEEEDTAHTQPDVYRVIYKLGDDLRYVCVCVCVFSNL
jgi:hypothetical protein